MNIKLIILILTVALTGCSNNKTTRINPLAVKALAGSNNYTVEIMLEEI